eukprot:GFKZ01012908.1.p1 GENE.GFKZ01012908.1~~GFKZ01012908.1.p1  ORF type:complete len:364 (+),score=64.40 GFKZ01012908.1:149-1240(+)
MHLLIIGGGIAGAASAVKLRKTNPNATITVVEPKDYVEVAWASIRALFDESVRTDCTLDLKEWATKYDIKHIHSIVTKLTVTEATLKNGDLITFDACLVATGAKTDVPFLGRGIYENGLRQRRKDLEEAGRQLKDADQVLVVGGGAVGAELAGDLADYAEMEGKKVNVTLVHSGDHLIPEMNMAGGAKVQKKLEDLGVKVILESKAMENNGGWLVGNENISADVVVKTVGVRSCNEFIWDSALDEDGWIQVDEYLRVEGGEGRIFAMGDCCKRFKNTATTAMGNAGVAAHNLNAVGMALDNKQGLDSVENKLRAGADGPPLYVVTTGHKGGVAKIPFGNITWGLPYFKNKTMFLFKARQDLGM